jgi:hypothetical protein
MNPRIKLDDLLNRSVVKGVEWEVFDLRDEGFVVICPTLSTFPHKLTDIKCFCKPKITFEPEYVVPLITHNLK